MQSGSCMLIAIGPTCQHIAPFNICSPAVQRSAVEQRAEGDKLQQCCNVLKTYNLISTLVLRPACSSQHVVFMICFQDEHAVLMHLQTYKHT